MRLNKTTFQTLQIRKKVNITSNLYFTKTSYQRGKWSLRYQLNGRIREMGLGSYPSVDLLKASERAVSTLKLLSDGPDPIAKKRDAEIGKNNGAFPGVIMLAGNRIGFLIEELDEWPLAF